jgi:hypothetical protein
MENTNAKVTGFVGLALLVGTVWFVLKATSDDKKDAPTLSGPARKLKSGMKVMVKNTGMKGKAGYTDSTGNVYVKFADGSDGMFSPGDLKKIKSTGKSKPASMVLKLIDKDYSYQQALTAALKKYSYVKKARLEKELDLYI